MSAVNHQAVLESGITLALSRSSTQVPALVRNLPPETVAAGKVSRSLWKSAFAWGLVAAVPVATLAVFQPWELLPAISAAAETHEAEPPKTVMIVRPEAATTSSVVLPATMRPWQSAALSARVSGYLSAWHRDLGSNVKDGEVLADIETPELDQEVAEGESLASEAAAAAVQAQAERTEAQAELQVVEAQLLRVRAEYELAKSQLVRRAKLMQNRSISLEEYETFLRQVEARAADVSAAEADVVRRRSNLDTRAAVIQARLATAQSRRSNVERLKQLQAFKRIVAPFDGVVTSRTAEVGMLVTAGQNTLFVIEDLSRIRVQINVPQAYAMRTAPGVAATIHLPESSARSVAAAITRVADAVDPTSRTMLVEIELDNGVTHFQPGSYAQVTLAAPAGDAAWTIPTNSLSMRVDGPHVALLDGQNQIEVRRVTLGRDLGDRVVVADGLAGDERLVVNPSDDLASGAVVRVDPRSEAGTGMSAE